MIQEGPKRVNLLVCDYCRHLEAVPGPDFDMIERCSKMDEDLPSRSDVLMKCPEWCPYLTGSNLSSEETPSPELQAAAELEYVGGD